MTDMPNVGTRQKALALNRDAETCGTIAEIGGEQEVARWFFRARRRGTVAKTISAYDMAISDGLYGPAKPYVSRKRVHDMLVPKTVAEIIKAKTGVSGYRCA